MYKDKWAIGIQELFASQLVSVFLSIVPFCDMDAVLVFTADKMLQRPSHLELVADSCLYSVFVLVLQTQAAEL